MAFLNLLRPAHRSRFLVALAAGAAALLIYLFGDQFKVVPGTAALDDSEPVISRLGKQSILVVPLRSQCAHNITYLLGLEIIRKLQRSGDIEVIAPRSALALADSRQLGEATGDLVQTAWTLRIGCNAGASDDVLFADLGQSSETDADRIFEQGLDGVLLQSLVSELSRLALGHMDAELPDDSHQAEQVAPSAYLGLLQARFFLTFGETGVSRATELLEAVTEEEPRWSPGLAEHAYSLVLQASTSPEEADLLLDHARQLLGRALENKSDHPESLMYQSIIAHRFDRDWQTAHDSARAALEGAPGSADMLATASTAAFTLGQFEEGLEQITKAIPLDPMVLSHRLKHGLMLEFGGKHQAAIDAYRELMALNPDYPAIRTYLGRTLVVAGRPEAALPHMEIESTPFWHEYGMVLVLFALERQEEAEQKFTELIETHAGEAAMQIAEINAFIDRPDEAFTWLQRAVEQGDPGVSGLLGNPLLESLAEDPRWADLLSELGLDRFEAVKPD